jgi:phage tail sheath protein FI
MAFQVSPGVNFSEVDLTAGAQQVSVSDAAFAGPFNWGPALEARNIGSEDDLVRVFGKPDDVIAPYWFSAQSFLAYSNLLHVVRSMPVAALNATDSGKALVGTVDSGVDGNHSNLYQWTTTTASGFLTTNLVVGQKVVITDGNTATVATFTVASIGDNTHFATVEASAIIVDAGVVEAFGIQVPNQTDYEQNWQTGTTGYGAWVGKYLGELGNSIKVSVCPSANAFANEPIGTLTVVAGNTAIVGSASANFVGTLIVGDVLTLASGQKVGIVSITNATHLVVNTAVLANATITTTNWSREWEFASLFDGAPGTSGYASARNGSKDEAHITVQDAGGLFSGTPGTVLERFPFVSKASDAKDSNGEVNYYASVVNTRSQYVWWLEAPGTNTSNWANVASGLTFGGDVLPSTVTLSGGQAASSLLTDAEQETAYDLYKNTDQIDISLVISGPASAALGSYIIQNICESRMDCVAFVSPTQAAVVNNVGQEVADITVFRNSLPSSSYGFLDSGWKYTFDKYNAKSRWVPLNGDMAGLAARSDSTADPWFSPAGVNRGNVKNVQKLAWNPKQLDRDDLYKIGVNSVVAFPGQGTILYGDKTLLSRPSAFDRINVRRLFIILEKTISRLAKSSLFEFNDDFTRSQFRNAVEPYLRDVKARRGVVDYRVICDTTNNTNAVVEQNRFVGDIYVKPSRSINFIQLNFVAVPSGVSFQEVTGSV